MEFTPGPVEGVFVTRTGDDTRALRRATEAGRLVRLRRGAFVDAELWRTSTPERRAFLRIAAVAGSRGFHDVLSHESAATLLGLQTLAQTDVVHATSRLARSTRSTSGLTIHAAPLDAADLVDVTPFTSTGPTRTITDLLFSRPFRDGVALLDSALHARRVERDVVAELVQASDRRYGRATAQRVLAFADPDAASPGESLSRVVIAECGFAVPELQRRFDDDRGLVGYTDFYWPSAGVVGEFDGLAKYSDSGMLRGRTPSQVVVEEKLRQDRLQAHPDVRTVTRWIWSDLFDRRRFATQMARAGVPRVSPGSPLGARSPARDAR